MSALIIKAQKRRIQELLEENQQLRQVIDLRFVPNGHHTQPRRSNLQLTVFKTARDLIEAHPTRQIHLNGVARQFPGYCPETIKRRVQELAQDGLLARLGGGYYTLPEPEEDTQ